MPTQSKASPSAQSGSPEPRKKSAQYSKQVDLLSLEGAFGVLARAQALERQGKPMIHLEIGEPDFDTPPNIKEAAIRSLQAGETHYSPSAGLWEARECVAEYVAKTRDVPIHAEEVFMAPGSKPILFFSILILIQKGDEVIIPNPSYPAYESIVRFAGGIPVPLPLREEEDFRFDIQELEKKITPKTRMIILNSPQNPTGGILTREDLEQVAYLSRKHDLFVVSDEIYSRIVYDAPFASALRSAAEKSRIILVDGFSKAFAMTGWRLGFGVMPPWMIEPMTKLMNNSNSCTCTFVQKAGMEALRGPQDSVEEMVLEFKIRRDILVEGLNQLPGFRCRKPKGAFYAFPNIQATKMKSQGLAERLLTEAGVALLPGTAFGSGGEGYLRFSYANSIENLRNGLQKIQEFLTKIA